MKVLPGQARYPNFADRVIVLIEVVVFAGKEKTNYFWTYFGPI